MSGQVEWKPKTASETVLRYADFTDELASGETVTSAVTSASVWSGNDPAPAIIVSSIPINNSFGVLAVVAVSVQAGVLGTIYLCLVTASTSSLRTITKTAVIAVRPLST